MTRLRGWRGARSAERHGATVVKARPWVVAAGLPVRVAALSALLLLGGCDTLAYAWMINNSGAPVRLRYDEGGREETARLANGEGRIIPNLPSVVEAAGCNHLYHWPQMAMNYPFEVYKDGYPLSVQIEPDLRLYILPYKTRRALPPTALAAVQHDGFPLSPAQSDCRK